MVVRFDRMRGITLILDVTEWHGRSTRPFSDRLLKDLGTYLRMRVVPPLYGVDALAPVTESGLECRINETGSW